MNEIFFFQRETIFAFLFFAYCYSLYGGSANERRRAQNKFVMFLFKSYANQFMSKNIQQAKHNGKLKK